MLPGTVDRVDMARRLFEIGVGMRIGRRGQGSGGRVWLLWSVVRIAGSMLDILMKLYSCPTNPALVG